MNEIKNKNLFIRVSQKEKNVIELNAEKCRLSVSEYLRQRALGYNICRERFYPMCFSLLMIN